MAAHKAIGKQHSAATASNKNTASTGRKRDCMGCFRAHCGWLHSAAFPMHDCCCIFADVGFTSLFPSTLLTLCPADLDCLQPLSNHIPKVFRHVTLNERHVVSRELEVVPTEQHTAHTRVQHHTTSAALPAEPRWLAGLNTSLQCQLRVGPCVEALLLLGTCISQHSLLRSSTQASGWGALVQLLPLLLLPEPSLHVHKPEAGHFPHCAHAAHQQSDSCTSSRLRHPEGTQHTIAQHRCE